MPAGPRLKQLKQPLAIAMWDFSWLLRHHRLGAFAGWDKTLDALVLRGYDAIRIDCFPHLVSEDNDGMVTQEYYHPKNAFGLTLWGNEFSVSTRPREALLEFLPKCQERGISVGLSTWFNDHNTGRTGTFAGEDSLVRAWDETLKFLDGHRLLRNVVYVDVLNEYPLWHGYEWLTKQLAALADNPKEESETVGGHEQKVLQGRLTGRKYNSRQILFYNRFISNVIAKLKAKWPSMVFFASLSKAFDVPWQDMDLGQFSALDLHIWFVHNCDFSLETQYFRDIHPHVNDLAFARCFSKLMSYWRNHRRKLVNWMAEEMRQVAARGKKLGIPVGSTEGWGAICWMDHPDLTWDFVKESGSICVDLAVKNGYSFICTSNFTHPQFPGVWNDIAWHKRLTSRIKNG
ncbi:MAG TPA: cellulase-like family protein [Candidatus Limnocylindrales bacterium]|nr:cellulase-like family protein [Candidatus Limnocylindrales bacterium]